MLCCVARNALFVPEHYTLTGHGRQTPGPFPHILHLASGSSVVLVFLELYSLVGSGCSCSSIIPAIVCVSAARHSVIQEKHSPSFRLFVLPTNRHQFSLPLLFFSILNIILLYSLTAALTLVSLNYYHLDYAHN